ncbi:hypothetical protein FRC12_022524 [Ceratobasidium sp. 428]|nr:hypothetical protein FRC12_022524 [Ceratobasidium sp. 428]
MKHLKHGVDRAKAKIHRLIDSPIRTTPATQSAVASNSELGQVTASSTQLLPAVASSPPSIRPESLDNTSHMALIPIGSAALNQDTHIASQRHQPSLAQVSSTQLPASNAPSNREENQVHRPDPTVTLAKSPELQSPKHTAWGGLKTLLNVLSNNTGAFAPLKSAFGGLWNCVEIFEVSIKNMTDSSVDNDMNNCNQSEAVARKEYDQLRSELNKLCQDISGYMSAPVPPSTTPSIKTLAQ